MTVEKFSDKMWLKRMLQKADKEALPCAFGVGAKPEDSRLLVHNQKPGKQLREMLKKEKSIKAATYGTARVDGKLLILDVAKKVAGLGKNAKVYVRQSGLLQNKVKILFEGADITEEEEGAPVPDAPAAVPTPAPEPVSEPAPEGAGAAGTFSKAIKVWDKTVEAVEKELKDFQKTVLTRMKGQADLSGLAKALKGVTGVLDGLDKRLDALLLEGTRAEDRETAHDIAARALKVLDEYTRVVKQDPVMRNLASNPFGKVQAEKIMHQSLDALRKTLAGI